MHELQIVSIWPSVMNPRKRWNSLPLQTRHGWIGVANSWIRVFNPSLGVVGDRGWFPHSHGCDRRSRKWRCDLWSWRLCDFGTGMKDGGEVLALCGWEWQSFGLRQRHGGEREMEERDASEMIMKQSGSVSRPKAGTGPTCHRTHTLSSRWFVLSR